MLNVGIIGAGQGGTTILKTLLTVADIKILGICDKNNEAPGVSLARAKGIPVFNNYQDLLELEEEKIIIEVTGNQQLREKIRATANSKTTVLDSDAALLITKIVNSREEIIKQLATEAENLANLAANISSTLQETSATSTENLNSLNATVAKLLTSANANQNNIQETSQIINFIKKISTQTKMLGFNAAIEANRAGSEGNGFRVVANEIRNLADETGQSVQKITELIYDINQSTEETLNNIAAMEKQAANYSTSQEKIATTLQQVAKQIEDLALNLSALSK